MKTNSLFKRLVSMLIVVLMICTLFPMTAFAATDIEISPNKKPSDYNYTRTTDGPTKDHGTIEKEVGDTGAFVRCPSNTVYGSYCGHSLGTFYPVAYCDIKVELSNPEIIGDISYSKGYLNNSECLQMNFTAKKAGTTKVKLTYYCNFMIDVWGGRCPRCGVWTNGQRIYTWYKYTDTFTVFVSEASSAPDKPNDATVRNLLTNAVKIHCEKHDDKTYGLIDNSSEEVHDSYSIGEVEGDATNGYTCDITVKRGKYIDAYNGTYEGHTADEKDDESKTITLKYQDDGTWAVYNNTAPVTFNVVCEDVPTEPEPPAKEYLEKLLANGAVTIHCIKDTEPNDDETYGLISKTYEIGEVVLDTKTNKYTCTITVTYPAPYAEQYNSDKHSKGFTNEHTLCPNQGSKTIILEYDESTSKWNVKTDSAPVTFNVVCGDVPTEPEPPAKEYLEKLLANGAVKIGCTNTKVNHADKTYGLLKGSYDIGKPQKVEGSDVYTCEITVYAAPYVAQYSTDMNKGHSLADVGSKKVILVYNGDEWIVPPVELAAGDDFEYESAFPVTFNVVCKETPVTTYTVTYKDGVGGKVFKDDVHTVESGATTPAFVGGIPTRPGYVFVGWTPTVSKTVTGNATYTATWRKVKDTTVIEIGGGNSSSSSSKEENPNTGAPVFVGVSVGALAAAK